MEWIDTELPPDIFERERSFHAGDLRLGAQGKTRWLKWRAHPSVGFAFGTMTELFEEPDLALGGTAHVLAAPPTAYVLVGEGDLGLDDVTTGRYRLTWLDLSTARVADGGEVQLDGGEESFTGPLEGPVGLVLVRIGR